MHARVQDASMPITEAQSQIEKWAELFLCLGYAFLPPRDAQFRRGLVHELGADLEELHAGTAFTEDGTLAAFRFAVSAIDANTEQLLVTYSRLFLSPPTPACLNAGMQLDGTIMGNSVTEIEELYRKYALARDAGFRDLPDHLALQLEFLGYLLALSLEGEAPEDTLNDARGFLERYLLSWVPALAQQCLPAERSMDLPAVYSNLATLTADALERVYGHLPAPAATPDAQPPVSRKSTDTPSFAPIDGETVSCNQCGKPLAVGSDLTAMIATLREKGLDTGHLAICPDCRTSSMGLHPMTPPRANKPGRG
jgi:putative dimethyl sulfoxide reductase chaperone